MPFRFVTSLYFVYKVNDSSRQWSENRPREFEADFFAPPLAL